MNKLLLFIGSRQHQLSRHSTRQVLFPFRDIIF